MNILRIIDSVDPRNGGMVEALRTSALAMEKLGHRTEVISLDRPGDGYVQDFPVPVHAMGRWTRRYGYTPKLARWIAENGQRFDVATIEGLWTYATLGGWWGLMQARLPYVVLPHGMLDPWFRRQYPIKHRFKQVYWTLGLGRVLEQAGLVLFTCEEERRLARGAFIGPRYRERVVAYGTENAPVQTPAQSRAFQELVPGLDDRPYLLFLSRLHEKKGCDLLISAFAEVAPPDLHLVIAGPDQSGLQQRLAAQAQQAGIGDRVHFPGMLQGDAKWGAFFGAEAFVLPSHQENFGVVVAEAMATGTPVLISNKVNIWREIEASGSGLVEDDTLEGTARVLRRWAGLGRAERTEMGRRARASFEKSFHIDVAVADLLAALEDARAGP